MTCFVRRRMCLKFPWYFKISQSPAFWQCSMRWVKSGTDLHTAAYPSTSRLFCLAVTPHHHAYFQPAPAPQLTPVPNLLYTISILSPAWFFPHSLATNSGTGQLAGYVGVNHRPKRSNQGWMVGRPCICIDLACCNLILNKDKVSRWIFQCRWFRQCWKPIGTSSMVHHSRFQAHNSVARKQMMPSAQLWPGYILGYPSHPPDSLHHRYMTIIWRRKHKWSRKYALNSLKVPVFLFYLSNVIPLSLVLADLGGGRHTKYLLTWWEAGSMWRFFFDCFSLSATLHPWRYLKTRLIGKGLVWQLSSLSLVICLSEWDRNALVCLASWYIYCLDFSCFSALLFFIALMICLNCLLLCLPFDMESCVSNCVNTLYMLFSAFSASLNLNAVSTRVKGNTKRKEYYSLDNSQLFLLRSSCKDRENLLCPL